MKILWLIPLLFFVLMAVNTVISGADNGMKTGNMETNALQQKAMFAGGCFWCMENPLSNWDH